MNSLQQQVGSLKMTARNICERFLELGIEFEILDGQGSLVRYKDREGAWHYLRSSLSDKTSSLALLIADQKPLTYSLCQKLGIKVPTSYVFDSDHEKDELFVKAEELIKKGDTVVIKPSDSAHGNGVTTNIVDVTLVRFAAEFAGIYSKSIILQEMIDGDDIRVIIINEEYIIAIKRVPANVVGDGVSTVRELVEKENNENTDRSFDFSTKLSKIPIVAVESYFGDNDLDDIIPKSQERVRVLGPSNMSMGGTLANVTNSIPQKIIEDSIKIASELKMLCCAVDFILDKNGIGTLLEINASPALFTLDDPFFGTDSGAIKKFVDAII